MKVFWRLWFSIFLLPLAVCGQGQVYLVIGSDTAVWNAAGGVDVAQYHGHFLPDLYIRPQDNAYKVMDPAFRNRFVDSYGLPLKLTWWMMVGSVYLQCDATDVPIPNLMPLYLMHQYHGEAIRQFGDEVSLHYHTFFWSDYDGDGISYWNQSRTFHEARMDFDFALAQSLIEEEVFPVSFRSGWHYMDNEWQQYLNLLLPFSMHNNSPNVHTDSIEPYDNVYDWSRAPLSFVPYHPSTTNYQVPGDGLGWNVRSVKMPNMTQALMNQMFAQAAGGTNQVACIWAHLPEVDFLTNIARIDLLAHTAASSYPTAQFRYCTAVEAMQRWLGTTDHTPPQLSVSENIQGETVTLTIGTDEPIFQPQPFVAVKDLCEQYRIVSCQPAGINLWTVVLPVPQSALAKVSIAVTDPAGNLTTRLIRYIPDDVFIDNLDPQYLELGGNWVQNTNAAWGIDSRTAKLGSNDVAQAQWTLPIARSGFYNIFVQVPNITNAASNVLFQTQSGTSNVLTVFSSQPLPGGRWLYLGASFLDQTTSNSLLMSVSGENQAGALAVADVVRLSPLVPQPPFAHDVQVDPSSTTANIIWSTDLPMPSLVEYGPGLAYGQFSATNALSVTNHVVTLSGLTPGTIYYFQISSPGGGHCPWQGSFKTSSNVIGTTLLFNIANVWKFSTSQLDHVNWQAPTYDDSAWSGGPGLLWADTRNSGPNPSVQPKGTPLPTNVVTKAPFVTYYFRTHFDSGHGPIGTILSFSNYIDDGAVFYLNGVEIRRINMAASPTVISNASLATGVTCSGDATCPVSFNISGILLTNLVSGDNVLAVEVHNQAVNNSDITFGSALRYTHTIPPLPRLQALRSADVLTIYWNETGYILQQSEDLGSPANWHDIPGPVSDSPYNVENASSVARVRFYRLRSR